MKQTILGILLCALAGPVLAAPAAVPPRQLDTMAERTAACIACHGAQGRATSSGYFPRIAGKPQAYLYQQLVHFRQGRRINPAMNHLVSGLSDEYLREMAAYFAAQHPPYPSPQPSRASAAQLERGRQLTLHGDAGRKVPACIACHGSSLTGMAPAIPGLLGLSRDYLNLQFGAWRTGVRRAAQPDCMAHIAGRLAPEDVNAVAAWLAAQPVPANEGSASPEGVQLPLPCGSVR